MTQLRPTYDLVRTELRPSRCLEFFQWISTTDGTSTSHVFPIPIWKDSSDPCRREVQKEHQYSTPWSGLDSMGPPGPRMTSQRQDTAPLLLTSLRTLQSLVHPEESGRKLSATPSTTFEDGLHWEPETTKNRIRRGRFDFLNLVFNDSCQQYGPVRFPCLHSLRGHHIYLSLKYVS